MSGKLPPLVVMGVSGCGKSTVEGAMARAGLEGHDAPLKEAWVIAAEILDAL